MTRKKQRKQAFKIIIIIALLSTACNRKNFDEEDSILFSLKMFSIKVNSSTSKKILSQSQDGYTGKLLINNLDTLYFNFGYDINNLSEKDPAVIFYPYDENALRNNLDTSLVEPNNIVYTKKPNFDIDEFRKQNVYFETIDGYRAKITVPREIKNGGLTGIYVDSLRKDEGGRLKFNFYSKHVDSIQNKNLLQIIRSIHFNL